MSETVNVRISKKQVDDLRALAAKHPFKPSLRSTIERAIELMIYDLRKELRNVR